MPYNRKHFFDSVRPSLFHNNLKDSQVKGCEHLLDVWERHFEGPNPRDGTHWLGYCFATVFHETAETMEPIEEYGKGKSHSYGKPVGEHNQCYYGRGYVQLTWETNYKKGKERMKEVYDIECDIHKEPHRMLEHEISALILYDGMIYGWYTGVGLPKYFNATTEDPKNARKIVNALDKADLIAGYYHKFKKSLVKIDA
jgi:putative chitinase